MTNETFIPYEAAATTHSGSLQTEPAVLYLHYPCCVLAPDTALSPAPLNLLHEPSLATPLSAAVPLHNRPIVTEPTRVLQGSTCCQAVMLQFALNAAKWHRLGLSMQLLFTFEAGPLR